MGKSKVNEKSDSTSHTQIVINMELCKSVRNPNFGLGPGPLEIQLDQNQPDQKASSDNKGRCISILVSNRTPLATRSNPEGKNNKVASWLNQPKPMDLLQHTGQEASAIVRDYYANNPITKQLLVFCTITPN